MAYAWPYWPGFLLSVGAMVITASTEVAFPALMKPLMDNGFKTTDTFELWWVPSAILGIFLARGISSFSATYAMQWLSNNVLRDLRRAMFNKLICLPSTFFDQSTSGQLISKLTNEVGMVLLAVTNILNVVIRDTFILIGLLAWLFWINWKLTFVVLFILPFLAALSFKFSRRMRKVSRNFMAATGDITSTIEEAISGNRVIKIFGGEELERRKFANANSDFRRQAMRITVAQALQSPASQFIAAIGVAIVVTIALSQARSGAASIGDFVSFFTAMLMMFSPLRHLTDINAQLQRGLAAAEVVFKFIDEHTESDRGTMKLTKKQCEIRFDSVSFRYPTRQDMALKNISLVIPPGKTYAFVGPSGGGKSTLVSLLPRLYEISSGKILIDGVSIQDLTLQSLRQHISLVSQDVILFNDTIANNICYGLDNISSGQLESVIKSTDLQSFIESLPDGLNTIVGDRGVRVSGGQRQRLAIARALLKDAPILILDEATSALDNTSESAVKAAIDLLRHNRTTLVVAHRLSTVINADQIVVLEGGEVVQSGVHDELVRVPGAYQNLYQKAAKSRDQLSSDTVIDAI